MGINTLQIVTNTSFRFNHFTFIPFISDDIFSETSHDESLVV